MSDGKVFLDTNVLLYMYSGPPEKRMRARQIFEMYSLRRRALVSTQVIQEFYAAGLRKLGMPRADILAAATDLLAGPLIVIQASHIAAAFRHEEQHKISFWDALIIAAAESGGAEILYTEDLNDGQSYGGVLVRNPFRDAIQ